MRLHAHAVGALLAAVLVLGAGAAGVGPGKLTRADVCGDCHRDIFRMWRESAHAKALEDPLFLAVYRETESREGAEVARLCLACHAPATLVNDDRALELKITWEGVGCDICHSISAVNTARAGATMVLEVGEVKRGPIRDAESMAHRVAFSELHGQSLACAPCHEFLSPEGVPLMATYSEWKSSAAARAGQSCQSCHMGRTEADVVDPVVKRVPGKEVNLHQVPGGHSLEQLHKALEVRITPTRERDELALGVRLRNKGAGHAVPTGMPGRRVVLEVTARNADGKTYEDRRVYGRTFLSASGEEISRGSGFFARGVRLGTDSRLQADETRTESFRFPAPSTTAVQLEVKLVYEHAPGTAEAPTRIIFYSEDRFVAALRAGP